MPKNPNQLHPQLSRRDFLKLAGLSPLLFVPRFPSRYGLISRKTFLLSEEDLKLQELGLEEYSEFYKIGKKIKEDYGYTPPIFNDIFDHLDGAVKGIINFENNEFLRGLRDGWGENKEQAVDHALTAVEKFQIDTSVTGDDPEEFRDWLRKKADNFPHLLLAMPEKVKITTGGGYAGSEEIGIVGLNEIGKEHIFLHETQHQVQFYWQKIKPYTDKKAFAEYIATVYHFLDLTAIKMADLPDSISSEMTNWYGWREITALTDSTRLSDHPQAKNELAAELYNILKSWSASTGINLNLDNANGDNIGNIWLSFTKSLSLKLRQGGTFKNGNYFESKEEFIARNKEIIIQSLYDGLVIKKNVEGVDYELYNHGYLGGINHYFVSVPTSPAYQIPTQIENNDLYLDVEARKEIQDSFLYAFSTLGEEATQEELREALDISEDSFIRPSLLLTFILSLGVGIAGQYAWSRLSQRHNGS